MPSKTDFNVSPYFDDYTEDKKFHRVMYRPAFAVQARELTTQQSITQNQIEQFGDHVFTHGAMVIPGQINYDDTYFAVKLTSFNGTLSNYNNNTLTGGTSGVVADVVGFVITDGTDPDTLFVKFRTSGTDNVSNSFTDGETITSGQSDASTAVVSTCVTGSAVHIEAGTYYINGFFVNVDAQTLVLDKYTNKPSYRMGLTIVETFITSTDDTTILDNATGSSNANATGAHRFKIDLTLTKLALTSTADASFVELARVENGVIRNRVDNTKYSHFEDTLARRTFDESGDYTVDNFDLDIREHLIDGANRGIYATAATSPEGNTASETKLAFGLSQGKAYVKGYEIKKIGTTYVDVDKARDFDTASGTISRFNIGSFVNVQNVFGTPDIGFVSGEAESFKSVRLVDEAHGTRGTVFGAALGHIYDVGRAKSRAFEHNSGSASTNELSGSTVTDTTFKHFLFDIEMFTHINVKGVMSGAVTTGDILTGGTSGATGVIESLSTATATTITGATQTFPVVVTASGGHTHTEGQQVLIASVSGMTNLNGNYYTVKNPTATTFELNTAQTAATTVVTEVDGRAYSAYSSGGTASHTTLVLNNVKGEFADGEALAAPTNSRTGVVQFSSLGCKGSEQKEFNQTKGISMAGSPTYTANVNLDATFGSNVRLSGTITTEEERRLLLDSSAADTDEGDYIINEVTDDKFVLETSEGNTFIGSGTLFTTELKIGDEITFQDNNNTTITSVIESIKSDTEMVVITPVGFASSTQTTSASFTRKRTKLQDANKNIALSRMPYDVVKTLLTEDNASVSDTSFKIRRQFVATLSSSGTATITAGTNELFVAFTENDYAVSIMTTGSGGTGAAGDVLSLSTSDDFTLGGSPTGKTLAIDLGSGYNGHKIKILATISASVVGAKTKTDTDGTKTVDTEALATAAAINLGRADVHQIDSIFMAADFSTAADADDTDVTDRFDLDTGQRDNFYDIGRIIRKNGALAPTGRLLVNFKHFAHGTGNFFSVDSYSGFDYGSIPAYTSDVTGEKFELRDVLDFRPRVDDASTIDSGDKDRTFDGTGASVIEVMKINTDVTTDLEFYLAKKGRIYLTSSGLFRVITGAPSLEPQFPEELKDSIHLYDISIPPYTFSTSDVKVKAVDNRRFTMRDIGRIQRRVENIEYYTQLSLLESDAKSMQIQDADGFDRFKNGIITDNFTGHGVGEVSSNDYKNSMDIANGQLRPAFHQNNINLIESDSVLANSDAMTDAIRTTNGYQLTGELITLPYDEEEFIDQPYASTTVNLNEYNTIAFIGQITLTPDNDEWMATETQPELKVDIPDVYDTLTTLASEGVLDLNLGTVWNNWNDTWSGVRSDTGNTTSTSRTWWSGNTLLRNNTTSVDVQERVDRTRTGIRTALIPGGVQTTSFGNRVVSVGFASFIRSKDIGFSVVGMKPLTRIFPFFDGIDISTYVTPTGSSAGAALTTDANGSATGTFALPSPDVSTNPKWRTGTRAFRLTSNSTNSLTGDVFTSAETDYIAKGMIQQVQGTVVSTREPRIARTATNEATSIQVAVGSRVVSSATSAIGSRQPPQPVQQFQGGGEGGGGGGNDPLAQGFYIDQEDGMFVTSIDVFFSAKDTALPVTMQIRPMVNGYPSSNVVLPFGEKTLQASEISTSTDATTATRFTFPSPVYVLNATEYCFVQICNTPEYTQYVAQLGQTTIDGGRLISSQPMLTSLFKSQNASTWTAEQNQTLKFKVNRASFTENTNGNLHLVNDEIPTQLLKQNPIDVNATAGSGATFGSNPAIIKINARNHGLHSTAHNVTIAGVPSGTVNGLASTNINGTYTAIGNITLDSFTVTAQNSDVATSTGSIGGSAVTITPNIQYDIIQPVAGLVQPAGSTITATIRTTGGRTLEQGETQFSLTTAAKEIAVELNNDHYMNSPGAVYSTLNETNEMSGSKSLSLKLTFSTPTGQGHISPIIDTTRLSAHLIQNRLNNPISGTTPEFVEETLNTGGSTEAKYQTKPVILSNESTALDIRITANVASTASVKMYYRLSNADDARKMDFLNWRPFNDDGSPDTAVEATENRYQFKEHKFSAKDLTTFTAFQLKITMTGTSSCYPPVIKDLRGIALAV